MSAARGRATKPDYSPVATIERCLHCHPEARRICTDIGESDYALPGLATLRGINILEILRASG
jgi:hypothetical protein